MFGFNVEGPTNLDAIDQYIGSYATPEAAETDTFSNARGGYDYLQKQYQAITGDAFADPFEEAKKVHSQAMTEAARNGASVASGSNTGMRLLSPPVAPVAVDPAGVTKRPVGPVSPATVATLQPGGVNAATRNELGRGAMLKMLQMQGNQFQLASKDSQIPDPSAANYMDVLAKRAALTGTTQFFEKIRQTNPNALQAQNTGDPRFARMQGKDGKAIGATIHPLAFDDTFQELARRDPNQANALYHAVTNRDYATDHDAQVQLIAEQRDARKKIIEGIKGLEADPVTGDLFKIVETKDFDGTIKQQRVPVTPLDKAAIVAEGGAKRIYGVDLPGMGGLKEVPTMTAAGNAEYKKRAITIHAKNPDLTTEQVSAQALASMKAEKAKITGPSQVEKPGLLETILQYNPKDALAAGVVNPVISAANATNKLFNVPTRAANALSALLGSKWRAQPTWDENMPLWNTTLPPEEVKQRALAAQILRERLGMAGEAYAGQ